MKDKHWIIIEDYQTEERFTREYKGGEYDDYIWGDERIVGFCKTEEEAKAEIDKYYESIKCWLVIEDTGAGSCWATEYTGGTYQEYTGAHGTVVGEYKTEEEANAEVDKYYESISCWLVIEDRAAGTCWTSEYTGGTYQQYTGAHGTVVGEYKTEEEARAELNEYKKIGKIEELIETDKSLENEIKDVEKEIENKEKIEVK